MVPSNAGPSSTPSNSAPRKRGSSCGPIRRITSHVCTKHTPASRLETHHSISMAFQAGLPSSSSLDGVAERMWHTSWHGNDGFIGVLRGKLIPHLVIWNSFWISLQSSLRKVCNIEQLIWSGQQCLWHTTVSKVITLVSTHWYLG